MSLRAQRGNLSFFCLLAVERRDRFVPRDPYCHCEPAKQSLFCLFTSPEQPRSLRASRLYFLSLRAQRGNFSFIRLPALNNRDRCPVVIASLRSNLSFVCFPALNNRDRFVPHDDRPCCASLRSNLSFVCLPALNNRDRRALLSCHCEPAKQSLFCLFPSPGKARSPYPEGTLRYARDDRPCCASLRSDLTHLVIASLRSNLSFVCLPA